MLTLRVDKILCVSTLPFNVTVSSMIYLFMVRAGVSGVLPFKRQIINRASFLVIFAYYHA